MSLSSPMNSDWNRPVLPGRGFPIRKSPDQSVFAAPRSLSQLTTSFVAYWCQGIHHALLINLTKNILANSSNNNSVKNCIYPLYAIVKEPSRFLTGKMVLSNSADELSRPPSPFGPRRGIPRCAEWWACLESNQGPRPYQGRALTN